MYSAHSPLYGQLGPHGHKEGKITIQGQNGGQSGKSGKSGKSGGKSGVPNGGQVPRGPIPAHSWGGEGERPRGGGDDDEDLIVLRSGGRLPLLSTHLSGHAAFLSVCWDSVTRFSNSLQKRYYTARPYFFYFKLYLSIF